MESSSLSLRAIADDALLSRLTSLVAQERDNVADIVEHLMEVDRRRLVLDRGHPSLFAYCLKVLGYSEAETSLRIRAARAAARFPRVLIDLREGRIGLDSVSRVYPLLNEENSEQLLEMVSGVSSKQVRAMVATLGGQDPADRDMAVPVRPEPAPPKSESAPGAIEPEVIPPPRYRFHFNADQELLDLVEKLRDLLRHKFPSGRFEEIFKEAAKNLIAELERVRQPRQRGRKASGKRTRLVPKRVKDEVWKRDGGRCSYVSKEGMRCESTNALEYDHVIPWADGGRSDTSDNIRLLCRAHNMHLGRKRFGDYRRKA